MKKYLFIIFFVIIIVISLIIYYINKNDSVEEIKKISIFSFNYNKGNSINSYGRYRLECNKKCIINIKPYSYNDDEEKIIEIDDNDLNKIIYILNKYNIVKWNNYKKYDKNVLDGNGFDLYIKYPKNYKEFERDIIDLLNEIYNK